jgi:hypothetical protein
MRHPSKDLSSGSRTCEPSIAGSGAVTAEEGLPVFYASHSTERGVAVRRLFPQRLSARAAIAIVAGTNLALWTGLISFIVYFFR